MNYKVLLVDDSKLARMSMVKALNALHPDWTRVEAANAEEALAVMKESAPDIALLDFNMPGRDGLDLAAELLQTRPGMPVAVISANRQTEVIERARAVGAVFVAKPLTEPALAEFLKTAVANLTGGRE